MTIRFDQRFKKTFDRLPAPIQKKIQKQIAFLSADFFHTSLRTKKKQGENIWEFRIDRQYRMTGEKMGDELILRTVGMHDKGLGKK